MNHRLSKTLIISILLFFVVIITGCARQPSMKRTYSIMQNYFEDYSDEYPDSIIGKYSVRNIKILHQEEIHKGYVTTYALLELENGIVLQTRFNLERKPLGWRYVSWENMGMAAQEPRSN